MVSMPCCEDNICCVEKLLHVAWYEWYPAVAYDFSGISFSAGDTVQITVTADSPTSGAATVENLSTGTAVTAQISSTSALCQQDAEWIVEDFDQNGGLVPFANFGGISFTGASAALVIGGANGPGGATLVDIYQNQVLAEASLGASDSTITVTYQT